MKIAMVSEHASPLATLGGVDAGGQNVHVSELAQALARRGHEVTVYTRRDDATLPERRPHGAGRRRRARARRAAAVRSPRTNCCRTSAISAATSPPPGRPRAPRHRARATSGCRGLACSMAAAGHVRCRSCRPSTRSASSSVATRAFATPVRPIGCASSGASPAGSTTSSRPCSDEVFELMRMGVPAAGSQRGALRRRRRPLPA